MCEEDEEPQVTDVGHVVQLTTTRRHKTRPFGLLAALGRADMPKKKTKKQKGKDAANVKKEKAQRRKARTSVVTRGKKK